MSDLTLTNHAVARMAQRAILPSDLEIILAVGSEVEGGILVREKDIECVERAVRSLLKRLQKMKGKRLVMADGCVVTAYHATDREQHRLMRTRH
jgi:hypothetical protein